MASEKKTRRERLAEWGVHLKKVVEKEHQSSEWALYGPDGSWLESDLDDYYELTETEAIKILERPDFVVTLDAAALSTRLNWYSSGYHDRGWEANIKLHDVWQWEKYWSPVTDQLEEPSYELERQMEEYAWTATSSTYDFWLATLPSALYPPRFMRVGRSGGHLIYRRDEMDLAEAEALFEVYETIPIHLKNVCQEIATIRTALRVADAWGFEAGPIEVDSFTLLGKDTELRMEVTYP